MTDDDELYVEIEEVISDVYDRLEHIKKIIELRRTWSVEEKENDV